MPQYVFCVEEAGPEPADEWTELLDIEEAKAVATRVARDRLEEQGDKLWGRPWRVVVTEPDGLPVLAISVTATMGAGETL